MHILMHAYRMLKLEDDLIVQTEDINPKRV